MRCAGVFSPTTSPLPLAASSSSNAGSTVTAPCLGCISVLATVMATITNSTITRLCGSSIVWLTGTGAVRAPLVAFTSASPGVAIVSGMEPERPACHTTKPL